MARKDNRRFLKRIDKTVDLIFVGFLLIVLIYSGYAWWDTNSMYLQAGAANYAMFRPNPAQEEEIGFDELQEINPNVFGWIHVFGTHIDYPLLQGVDNLRYVETNARGEHSAAGAIFLDFRNNQNFTDFNNIIYGHDMDRGAMFGDIALFEENYFFHSRRFGTIFTGEKFYGLEIFSFLFADAYDNDFYNPNITDDEQKIALIERIFEESIQYRDLALTVDDRLVVMSTCTPTATNGRHLLVARLMDEIPEDSFEGDPTRTVSGIDRLIAGVGEIGLIIGAILILFLTVGITTWLARRKRKAEIAELMPKVERRKRLTLREELLFLFGKIGMIGLMLFMCFNVVFGFVRIEDASMEPSLRESDIVLFQRIGASHVLARDVVVVEMNGVPQVRRAIAVAGDTVDITERGLEINGRVQSELGIFEITEQFSEGVQFPLVVPEGEIFVMGDSRARSRDSRIYGTISLDDVLGSVVTVLRGRNI